MKIFNKIVILLIIIILIGCNTIFQKNNGKCGFNQPKPNWIIQVPRSNNDYIYFVGLSNENVSSERRARDEALKHARVQLVNYLGTDVKDKMEEIIISMSLSSENIDPLMLSQEFKTQFSKNVATQVHGEKFHVEFNQRGEDCVCKVYTLCSVPTRITNNSIRNFANDKLKTNEYIEFWEKLRDSVN